MTNAEIERDFVVWGDLPGANYMGGSSLHHAGMEPPIYKSPSPVQARGLRYPVALRQQARDLYTKNGMTIKAIAYQLNVPYNSVWNFLQEGDPAAPPGGQERLGAQSRGGRCRPVRGRIAREVSR